MEFSERRSRVAPPWTGGGAMTFVNLGLFAVGASAISIPIIIHLLFRRRRKPIVWAAMRFLIEAYKQQRRRLRLQHLLLLATRCLLLLLIAMALGRPVARSAALGLGGGRTVYFLIDNSLVSTARAAAADGPGALDRHKAAAHRMLDALGPGDRAGLIALGSPAQEIVIPASADLAAISDLIDALEPTDSRADFAGAFSSLAGALRADNSGARSVAVVLSSFRLGAADASSSLDASLTGAHDLRLVASTPAEQPMGNVQILSVDPLRRVVLARGASGSATVNVRVKLRRVGASVGQEGSTTLLLSLQTDDGSRSRPTSTALRWRPGQTQAEFVTPITIQQPDESFHAALVASIDRDAIEGDNALRRPIEVRSTVRVGIAARRRFGALPSADALSPGQWLRLALAPIDTGPITITDVDPGAVDAPTLAALDALLIPRPDLLDDSAWRRVGDFARAGGLVFITPHADETVHLWSDRMAAALGLPWRLAREATDRKQGASLENDPARSTLLELLTGELAGLMRPVKVFRTLPVIEGASAPGVRTLLRLADGEPWLLAAAPGASAGAGGESKPNSTVSTRGLVIYLTSAPALDWTDLPARPFFVPLMQELVRQGSGEAEGGSVFVAGGRPQPVGRVVELAPVETDSALDSITIASNGLASRPIRRAGLWRAVDRQGVTRGLIAVNADADAGRTEVQTPQSVREWLLSSGARSDSFEWFDEGAAAGSALTSAVADTGAALGYPLLIAAAALAALELLLARLFSYASKGALTPARAPTA